MPATKGERSFSLAAANISWYLLFLKYVYIFDFKKDAQVRVNLILWLPIFIFRAQSFQHRAQVTPASKPISMVSKDTDILPR